jgi:MerR family transcriptional regulator, light-induced transcriptional regulator
MAREARASGPVEEPEVGGGLSIQEVSRLLQVPAPTIRSWERRYGIPATGRSQGGHRRFFPPDIRALALMRDEVARGRRAAEAAEVVRAAGAGDPPHEALIEDFLAAARRLDPRSVSALLDHAKDELGLDETISGVLLPAMRRVGVWWQTGQCDVAHEHLATEAVRSWMNRLLYLGPAPWQPEVVLLSCGPRDLHTIGLEALGLLLVSRGWPCRLLGARTPANSLAAAVEGTGASAVVLVSHLSVARRSAVEALRTVESSGAALFYSGNAFTAPQRRVGVPGRYLGDDMISAVDVVTSVLVERRASSARRPPSGQSPASARRPASAQRPALRQSSG